MIGIMFLYWKLFQKKTLAELGFTKNACAYFVGAFAGLVLIIVSVVSVGFTGALTYHGLFSNIDYIYILLMLGGFICQGAMEEVLCRGIVLQLLKDKTRIPVVVGVSTALFIIPHLDKMTEEGIQVQVFLRRRGRSPAPGEGFFIVQRAGQDAASSGSPLRGV